MRGVFLGLTIARDNAGPDNPRQPTIDITGMENRRSLPFRSLLLGAAWLAAVPAGCVHLPPTVKAEMERTEQPADNNFARDARATQSHANAAK